MHVCSRWRRCGDGASAHSHTRRRGSSALPLSCSSCCCLQALGEGTFDGSLFLSRHPSRWCFGKRDQSRHMSDSTPPTVVRKTATLCLKRASTSEAHRCCGCQGGGSQPCNPAFICRSSKPTRWTHLHTGFHCSLDRLRPMPWTVTSNVRSPATSAP